VSLQQISVSSADQCLSPVHFSWILLSMRSPPRINTFWIVVLVSPSYKPRRSMHFNMTAVTQGLAVPHAEVFCFTIHCTATAAVTASCDELRAGCMIRYKVLCNLLKSLMQQSSNTPFPLDSTTLQISIHITTVRRTYWLLIHSLSRQQLQCQPNCWKNF
jgi:hypothetical protein